MAEIDDLRQRRLLPILKELWGRYVERNFEGLFILVVLVSVGGIGYFVDQKLALLNFFFIPVLLAGYFLSVRSAVMGSVLSILWVCLFVTLSPESFYVEPTPMGLYVHLVAWGSFLVLCGVLVARLNEQLLDKFGKLRTLLEDWRRTQTELGEKERSLEDRRRDLESLRSKFESVLYSSMDAVTAHLAIEERLKNEKREITVLCADFVDFMRTADQSPPEEVVSRLNELLAHLEPVIASYHGRLDRIESHGLMAHFGMPVPASQSPTLGVLAGLMMQRKAAARQAPWKMRVGISHGPALVGLVGAQGRRSHTAMGGVVNIAVKLDEICPPGGVCIDANTRERVGPAFHCRRLFTGRAAETAEALETQFKALREHLRRSREPSFDAYMEAGRLACELGEAAHAIAYYEKALSLDPGAGQRVRDSIAEVRYQQEANRNIAVKGEIHPLAVFEVVALRDPFDDFEMFPPGIAALSETLFRAEGLNRDLLLPLEALKGCLGHSQVTAVLSYALADAMGLSDDARRSAFLAGFYHDIGMRNFPPSMADKDEASQDLSPSEAQAMRSHPASARVVLSDLGIELPGAAVQAIEEHHENFDGSGYPAGLSGQAVTLPARIVRIADEYDILTGLRPGRWPLAATEALAAMRREADLGGQFDPRVLDVFARVMSSVGGPAPQGPS